jgi:hypothetical protein
MPNGNPELHISRTVFSVAFLGLVKKDKSGIPTSHITYKHTTFFLSG